MEEKSEDDQSDSRAGTRVHPVLTTVNDRVEYISELMAEGIWSPDTTKRLQSELSEFWSVSKSSIRTYSAEAARTRLEAVKERRAEVAKRAIDSLLEVATAAVAMPGDRAAKVAASKTLLEFAGIDKPDEDKIQRHVVAGMTDATPEKAREVMRGLFGTVTPVEPDVAEPDK